MWYNRSSFESEVLRGAKDLKEWVPLPVCVLVYAKEDATPDRQSLSVLLAFGVDHVGEDAAVVAGMGTTGILFRILFRRAATNLRI